jgi:hypothetical protein
MIDLRTTTVGLGLVLALAAGCGDDPAAAVIDPGDGGDYQPNIEAADFVDRIDNPYLPFLPGSRWVYEGEADGEAERIEITVLDERREVYGVQAVVVQDQVFVNGELAEDTRDWYAQDRDGNVWYLGEDTAEYEDGVVTTRAGSWEAGVDGALPGIIMPATFEPGHAYRQEFYAGEAEDMAEVLRVGGSATVPAGSFDDVVTIREWTPLEPDVIEEKQFAPGVGVIIETTTTGDPEQLELVEFTPGA